jgi:hypothetical protein
LKYNSIGKMAEKQGLGILKKKIGLNVEVSTGF